MIFKCWSTNELGLLLLHFSPCLLAAWVVGGRPAAPAAGRHGGGRLRGGRRGAERHGALQHGDRSAESGGERGGRWTVHVFFFFLNSCYISLVLQGFLRLYKFLFGQIKGLKEFM